MAKKASKKTVQQPLVKSPLKLIFSIVICELAGVIGSIFTISSIPTWYQSLNKPSFGPPNYIFGPVWTLLYLLMGIALYWVWEKGLKKKEVWNAILLFKIHLLFNISWSIVFFGLRSPGWAFLNILILWTLIIKVIFKFQKIDQRAAMILLPYLFWVSFATILNYQIWILNK